jgi:hypothetical protein
MRRSVRACSATTKSFWFTSPRISLILIPIARLISSSSSDRSSPLRYPYYGYRIVGVRLR